MTVIQAHNRPRMAWGDWMIGASHSSLFLSAEMAWPAAEPGPEPGPGPGPGTGRGSKGSTGRGSTGRGSGRGGSTGRGRGRPPKAEQPPKLERSQTTAEY